MIVCLSKRADKMGLNPTSLSPLDPVIRLCRCCSGPLLALTARARRNAAQVALLRAKGSPASEPGRRTASHAGHPIKAYVCLSVRGRH